jgi:uncharacterized protein YecE (DUF72 family)
LIDKCPRQIAADWIYLRFRGDHYGGNYAAGTLKTQARWIRHQLGGGKNILAYFNNDLHGYAVRNAAELRH